VCFLSQVKTDATLQAYACSGQVGASCRVKWISALVKSGPTQRSRHAFTWAESWPRAASSGLPLRSNRDRRHAPGVRLLRPNRGLAPRQAGFLFGQIGTDATLQACVYSGQIVASRRVKRTSSSGMMISDRLGSCALKMRSVPRPSLTPPKGTSKTMPPRRGSIASAEWRKHSRNERKWTRRDGGTLTYITCQK
jgi:hypothetical protein